MTLHLGLGLHLETSTWLSSPVFMEVPGSGRSSLRIEARGWIVQPAPGKQLKLLGGSLNPLASRYMSVGELDNPNSTSVMILLLLQVKLAS